MNRVERQGVRADFEVLRGGVLVVEWQGLVSLPAAEAVKRVICSRLTTSPVAVVSDYRAAVLAMGDADLIRIMLGGQHDLPELPAAVLAPPPSAPALWRASVTAALLSRRWRRVCQERAEALSWADSLLHPLIHTPTSHR